MLRRVGNEWQFRRVVVGPWCTLDEPHGPASRAQVAWLERHGLPVADRRGRPLTKLEAALEIDRATTVAAL